MEGKRETGTTGVVTVNILDCSDDDLYYQSSSASSDQSQGYSDIFLSESSHVSRQHTGQSKTQLEMHVLAS